MARSVPVSLTRVVTLLWVLCACGPLWAQGAWDVEVLDPGVPKSLGAGEKTVVRVTLVNRGSEAWDPADGFAVAAHWLAEDHDVIEWEGVRTPLVQMVGPGATVTLEAALLAPGRSGLFLVQWDVLQEGVFWIADRDPTPVVGSPVEVFRTYSFVLRDASRPRVMTVGVPQERRLLLGNNGTVEWTPDGYFGVVGRWRHVGFSAATTNGPRTYFATGVKPGDDVEIEARLRPPPWPGLWLLEWDLVHEDVCFFSERMGDSPSPVLVLVIPSVPVRWLLLVLGIVVLLVTLRSLRNSDGVQWAAGRGDLIWLVLLPYFAERSVVEGSFGGGMVTLACLAAVVSLVALTGRRVRPWLAWGVGGLLVSVFITDRVYRRYFSDLPSIGSLETMGQTDEIGRSILSLFDGFDVFLLVGILAGGVVAWMVSRKATKVGPLRRRAAVAVLVCGVAGWGLWWAAERPIHRQVFRRIFVARDIGVAAAHILDIGRGVRGAFLKTTVSRAELDRLKQFILKTGGDRRGGGSTFGLAKGMNVVMVQAESVQAFVIGLEVGGQLVMPHLTRWATEGLWFTEVSDQTGHGRSSDAELITQTSLLALTDGAAAFKTATNHFTSLAGVLADRGYETVSAVPFDGAFWNRATTHRAYGYETSLFAPDFGPGRRIGWGLNDRDFLQQMGDRLAVLPRPFCAWMLTLSLHHPFEGFPDDLQELDVGKWEGGPVGEYLHTMHYLDQALDDLERRLEAAGLLEETIIVVWGDHDAGFSWTPEIADLMGVTSGKVGWYRSQRVPLVIKAPERLELNFVIDRPSGHVDVAPTIAALLGIDSSDFAWMGRNALGDLGLSPVVGEYGCWAAPEQMFLQGETGTLESGLCLENPSLEHLTAEECGTSFQRARERVAVAQKVLRFDLQKRLTERLQAEER
jgi:phosphoglycerol transferase MdoB-like AlkP superfamily enzyme